MSVATPVSYYPAAGFLRPRTTPRVVAGTLALVTAVLVQALWHFFVTTSGGQRVERLALAGAAEHAGAFWRWAEPALDAISVGLVVIATGLAILIAIIRRRWVLAIQVAALVAGANATTQLLKSLYPRPVLGTGWTVGDGAIGVNTLPSGHTTVAASVAAAMLIAVPRRWRPLVAVIGALWTIAVGTSTIVHQWHRPSDVMAAVLVVFVWGAAVCALSSRWSLDVPAAPQTSMAVPASYVTASFLLLGGGLGVAGALIALGRLISAGEQAAAHQLTAYGGGLAAAIGATAITFGLLLLIRQATATPQRYRATGYEASGVGYQVGQMVYPSAAAPGYVTVPGTVVSRCALPEPPPRHR
jgi:membrane-associated phospholipid phosphatase